MAGNLVCINSNCQYVGWRTLDRDNCAACNEKLSYGVKKYLAPDGMPDKKELQKKLDEGWRHSGPV